MNMLRMLVACEFSGVVRDAFADRGWDAWSCDFLPTESIQTEIVGHHIQGDVLDVITEEYQDQHGVWDLMIAHPPCTYLATIGSNWMNHPKHPNRRAYQLDAIKFL